MIRLLFSALTLLTIFKTEAQTSVLKVADSLYALGHYSKAIAQYKAYDNPSEVHHKIARSYIALGNYDEGLINYEKAVEANPENTLLKYDYGKFLYRIKNYKKAAVVFNKLVYIDYKNPNFHYELGLALERLKDSTAQNRFFNAFQLDTTHQKAIYKIAKEHLKKGRHNQVDRYVDIGLKSFGNNKELISLKAQNKYAQRHYREAVIWFEKLLELGESSPFIHEKLSLCYYQMYDFEKAIDQRKLVLKFNPLDATAIYVIGTYYSELRDYKQAEEYISKALALLEEPLDEEYMKLGTVLNQQKKYKEAIEALKSSLKENPNNSSTQFFLVRTKDAYYEDLDAKIKLYEDFKKRYPKNPFMKFAQFRLDELKEEKFLKTESKKD